MQTLLKCVVINIVNVMSCYLLLGYNLVTIGGETNLKLLCASMRF